LSSNKIIRLYDRSRVVTDWQCPRKRYWQYEYNSTGIVPDSSAIELYLGTIIHDSLAAIAGQTLAQGRADIDCIAGEAGKQVFSAILDMQKGEDEWLATQFAREQSTLIEGLVRGFYRHAWPNLLARYPRILLIEEELIYLHGPNNSLGFMSKPDLVLGSADESETVYIEYKSTSSKKTEWINSWDTAVQLHSTARAIGAKLGREVTSIIVQGLYKGYESYGKQSSPFCYAYTRKGNPPFTKDETRYDYASGFKRAPVWEMHGGIAAWVEGMPSNILADQFPQTPSIFINDDLVDGFFRQREERESDIDANLKVLQATNDTGVFDRSFPQRFDQCKPGWGRPCGYRKLCFGREQDPLKAGYIPRVPHHQPELDQWEEGGTPHDALL
jgi:hypothetical protein